MTILDNNPNDTLTQFVSLQDIADLYFTARASFLRRKKVYTICRSHCRQYGGSWPALTRKAKVKYFQAAREARQWQTLYQHMQNSRTAVKFDLEV